MNTKTSMIEAINDLIKNIKQAENDFFEMQHYDNDSEFAEWMTKYTLERNAFKLKLKGILHEYENGRYVENALFSKLTLLRMDMKLNKILDDHSAKIEKLERQANKAKISSKNELRFRRRFLPYQIKKEFFGSQYFKNIWKDKALDRIGPSYSL